MYSAANLFQLQAELIDGKVNMAVSKAIMPVLEKLESFRYEMHQEISGLRHEMSSRLAAVEATLGSRLSAVETALGMRKQSKSMVKGHFLDYSFKAGWLIIVAVFSVIVSYLTPHLHAFFR